MTREELKTEVMRWTPALLGMGKECTDKTLEAQKAIVDMLEHQPQGDLISRKEVAEILNHQRFGIAQISWDIISEKIKALPPAEPKVERNLDVNGFSDYAEFE